MSRVVVVTGGFGPVLGGDGGEGDVAGGGLVDLGEFEAVGVREGLVVDLAAAGYVEVAVVLEGRIERESKMGLVVPQVAVNENGSAPWVLKVQDGKAQRVDVTVGLRDEQTERLEITRGVAAGDLLLVGAAQGMTPGTPLRVRAQATSSN